MKDGCQVHTGYKPIAEEGDPRKYVENRDLNPKSFLVLHFQLKRQHLGYTEPNRADCIGYLNYAYELDDAQLLLILEQPVQH